MTVLVSSRRSRLLGGVAVLMLSSLLAAEASAQCGGFCIYEIGTADMGHSGAGMSGRAADASTAFTNPAGMPRLDKGALNLGLYGAFFDVEFDNSGETVPPPGGFGNDGGNTGGFLPGLGSFAVVPIADELGPLRDLRFGFGLAGLFGGAAEYADDWVGRHFITDVSMVILDAQPSLAARVTDWLSLGAALNVFRGELSEFELILPGPAATKVNANHADDWETSFSVSFLLEPWEGTRIGGVYRYKADMNLTGGNAPDFEYAFELPQGFNISVVQDVGERLTLYFDAGWSDWSEFSQNTIVVGPADVTFDRRWNDTWRVAGGFDYAFADKWTAQGGISYDSSPVKASRRTPDLPVSEAYRFSVGLQHDYSENVTFGLTYTFLWFGNMKVDHVAIPPSALGASLDGQYDPAWGQFIGATFEWRFCSPLPWVACPSRST